MRTRTSYFVIRNQNKKYLDGVSASISSSARNQIHLFSARFVPLGRGVRQRLKVVAAGQKFCRKSILPQGIQHKGYLRFPKPVSFHRDFWGEEQCCKHKCVKILMEETVRRTHCDQISKEKLIAHLLRQIEGRQRFFFETDVYLADGHSVG